MLTRERPGARGERAHCTLGTRLHSREYPDAVTRYWCCQLSDQPQVETSEPISGFTLWTELNPGPCSGQPMCTATLRGLSP